MKKIRLLVAGLLLFVIGLGGCNLQNKKTEEKNNPNQQANLSNTTQQNQSNQETAKKAEKKSITIYIDKNCQLAGIPQCDENTIKQQISPVLGNNFKIKYLTGEKLNEIKNAVGASPVMEFNEEQLSLFGQYTEAIKQSAKKINNTYYLPLFGWIPGEENLCNDGKDNNNDGKIDENDPTCYEMVVLTSSKCKEPYCSPDVLKNMFLGYYIKTLDYNSEEGKQIYDKLVAINQMQYLPTFLFNKKHAYIDQMKNYVKELSDSKYKYQLNIPTFTYDPSLEACATNCDASDACKKLLVCNKSDKPNVELFIMSYCPFGIQAQKGILPVIRLLKDKINFSVKFVNYIMHEKKEIDENTVQHCIQKEQPDKYLDYLECFLEKGDTQGCLDKVGIDKAKLNACIKKTDEQYNITKNYDNKSSWISGRFPKYEVDNELNIKYGIQGSPTLVINGIVVQTGRSPKDYLKAICEAFKNPPEECKKELSSEAYDPGFGWTKSGKSVPAGSCGE